MPFCSTTTLSIGGLRLSSFWNSHVRLVLVYVVLRTATMRAGRGGSPYVSSVCSTSGALGADV